VAIGGDDMTIKSANSQGARNAGLVATGFMVSAIVWSIVGVYGYTVAPFVGIATYLNDVKGDNDPSKLDPAFTTIGGGLFALLMYAVQFL
jgi:hypothetical protein